MTNRQRFDKLIGSLNFRWSFGINAPKKLARYKYRVDNAAGEDLHSFELIVQNQITFRWTRVGMSQNEFFEEILDNLVISGIALSEYGLPTQLTTVASW